MVISLRKFFALLLTLVILVSTCAAALAVDPSLGNFKPQREYRDQFTDVSAADWFYSVVKLGYEIGLIDGTSATTYGSGSNVTLGQILALAARLHSVYNTGAGSFEQGDPWYQVYVDYAGENGFLLPGLDSYNRPALRKEVAAILANALPASELAPMNTVDDDALPDVKMGAQYADEIYTLYRAGVLTGNDTRGTFLPDSEIRRSEIAAIVSRMAIPGSRQARTFRSTAVFLHTHLAPEVSYVGGYARFYRAVQGITLIFDGSMSSFNVIDLTSLVLTRDGSQIDTPPLTVSKIIEEQQETVVVLSFASKLSDPGIYRLTGRCSGQAFTTNNLLVEASVSDAPASQDALDLVNIQGTVGSRSLDDDLEMIYGIDVYFSGLQQSIYRSDFSLSLTRNGTEVEVMLEEDWTRGASVDGNGWISTWYSFDFEDKPSQPGTYVLSGTYRGKTFATQTVTIR